MDNQKDDQQDTAPVQPFQENGPTVVSVQVTLEQQHQSSAEDSLESYQPNPFKYHLYHRPPGIINSLSGPTYLPLSQMLLHVNETEKLLHEINSSKTTGPDQVQCCVLKEVSIKMAPVLTPVFT